MAHTRESIDDVLANALQDMKVNATTPLDITLTFNKDLGIDSLGRAELIARLERHFRIQVSDKDYARLTTVGETVDYIHSRLINNYASA